MPVSAGAQSKEVNLNSTTPAAPAGYENATVQGGTPYTDPNNENYQVADVTFPVRKPIHGRNDQTGTTYTLQASDARKAVVFNSSSPVAVTVPTAGSAGFEDDFYCLIQNIGTGAVTLTGAINGGSSLVVSASAGCWLIVEPTGSPLASAWLAIVGGGGFANPMTTVGDLIVGGTVTGGVAAPTRLASGISGYALMGNGVGVAPTYQPITAGGSSVPYIVTPTAPPLVASLAWVNQSTSTAVDAANGIYFTQPFGSTQFIAALVQNAPGSTPWTFTAGFIGTLFVQNFNSFGICVTDGTKITTFRVVYNATVKHEVDNWNSATSFSGTVATGTAIAAVFGPILWLRVKDDGTNLIFSISADGINFTQFTSVLRLSFLASVSKIGIQAIAQAASGSVTFTNVSWNVA